ncbi:MAG: acyltransferase family protein [Fimbriiglobus sp.]
MNTPAPTPRLVSMDAYRGFVMLLMLAEVLRLPAVAKKFPESAFWQFLGFHQSHVDWVGCSLHDLIQPSFSFLVGVAVPFSLASRGAQSALLRWGHVVWRACLLVALGIFLRSIGQPKTHYTFEDTLTQIGLGYVPLIAVAMLGWRGRLAVFVLILVGYWLAFVMVSAPQGYPDAKAYGVPVGWPHLLEGFAGHWNKNANAAWAFDVWFMNLFPRSQAFVFNGGGYSTLSFIPTLATMMLGLFAGTQLRTTTRPWVLVGWFLGIGVGLLALGYGLGLAGICPVVKRIWTPSWVLFSGGWCLILLALFHLVTEALSFRKVAFPLVVVGSNSIAAYLSEWLAVSFIQDALKRHLPEVLWKPTNPAYEPLILGTMTLAILWLGLWGMYRKRWFLKI